MHFDLTSASLDDQQRTVARALQLGARHIDVGQRPGDGHPIAVRGPKITWSGPPLMSRTGRDPLRFDLAPPAGGAQQAEVDRLLALDATRIQTGRGEPGCVELADPDGNEFCVLTPRQRTSPGG